MDGIHTVVSLVDVAWDALYGVEAGPYENAVCVAHEELTARTDLTDADLDRLFQKGIEYASHDEEYPDDDDLIAAMGVVQLAIERGAE
jgi:hypothetical protein